MPWPKGVRFSADHRAKISAQVLSRGPEWRAKISAALVGKPMSKERNAKISAAKRGRPAPSNVAETLRRFAEARRGVPVSERTRAKMSASHKTSEVAKAHLVDIRRRRLCNASPSSIELAVRAVLDGLGVAYSTQHHVGPYTADIFVPSHALIIECDGTYWHRNREAFDRDRDAFMATHGYSVLRLPEREIRAGRFAPRVFEALEVVA